MSSRCTLYFSKLFFTLHFLKADLENPLDVRRLTDPYTFLTDNKDSVLANYAAEDYQWWLHCYE
ncbi:MAG TPA: hypothetical protein VN958_10655 [Chitinophagaceae bacterium]|nr:hypothetical protein [Chitinophagaceae bacterium]